MTLYQSAATAMSLSVENHIPPNRGRYDAHAMATTTETLDVEGIRCERCVQSLAVALGGVEGLAGASATLMGEVTIAYDTPEVRTAAVAAIEAAGFSVA
jgi:copper chaperone CopZ